ncbi:MAG: hypothetical protein AMXMBFR48_10940 [Ignavibacteriales bacterium]
MYKVFFLLLVINGVILPDVIIRPREPEEKKFFLDISAVDSFPGKVFILSNLNREYITGKEDFTNLSYDDYIEIEYKAKSPVLYVFDGERISPDVLETGNKLNDLIKKLDADSITYFKTVIDFSDIFNRKYGDADVVVFTVKVELGKGGVRAAIVSAQVIIDSEQVEKIPFEYEAGMFQNTKVLFGDVAPEPEGLFVGDMFYFLLPLAGVIALLIIYLRRKSSEKKQ